jgi:toxin ParE1/3/4
LSDKPVQLLARAELDLRRATAWYRAEVGEAMALKWANAAMAALRRIGSNPRAGSPRYSAVLILAGLRSWPVSRFPYLLFYIERETQVDVWRVLHARRDTPAWMGSATSAAPQARKKK